jgi:HEAT repeat protein
MQVYLKTIAKIVNSNPNITSLEVWVDLCKKFYSQHNPHMFHQPVSYYLRLVREFADFGPEQLSEPDIFQQKLNAFFNRYTLDTTNELTVMLRTFLICYPEYSIGLQENITNVIEARPYHIPVLLTDLNAVCSDFKDEDDINRKRPLLISSAERFSTSILTRLLFQLDDVKFLDPALKRTVATELLCVLLSRIPEIDFDKIIPKTFHALSFIKIRQFTSDEEDDYFEHPETKKLVELVARDDLILDRIVIFINEMVINDYDTNQKSIIEVLTKLVDNSPINYTCILATLRCLLPKIVGILKFNVTLLLCKISNDVSELTMLLASASAHDDTVFDAIVSKIGLLAKQTPENHVIIISILKTLISTANFSLQSKLIMLMSNFSDNVEELELHLPTLQAKLLSGNDSEKIVAIDAIYVVSQKVKNKIPDVLPALITAMKASFSKIRENVADGLTGIARNVTADFNSVVPSLLDLLRDPKLKVRNCTINALGQIFISSHPPIPMTMVMPIVVSLLSDPAKKYTKQEIASFIGEVVLYRTADYTDVLNDLILKIQNQALKKYGYKNYINAIGKIANQSTVDTAEVIQLLVDKLIKNSKELNDTIITALLKICEKKQNIDLVVSSLLIKIKNAHWSFVPFLADSLNLFMDSPLPINFDKAIDAAKGYLNANNSSQDNAFDFMKSFYHRPEVDIEKIITLLLTTLQDSTAWVRRVALETIRKIQIPLNADLHLKIMNAFKVCLNDSDDHVRFTAACEFQYPTLKPITIKARQQQENSNIESKDESKNLNISNIISAETKSEIEESKTSGNKRKFMDYDPDIYIHLGNRGRGRGGRGRPHYGKWRVREASPPVYKRQKIYFQDYNEEKSSKYGHFESIDSAKIAMFETALNSPYANVKRIATETLRNNPLLPITKRKRIIEDYIIALNDTNSYIQSSALYGLVDMAKHDDPYMQTILAALVEKLNEDNEFQRQTAIIQLAKTKLNAQQKNYLFYGLLLHKLHSTQNQAVRFNLIKMIDKICRQRELDYHLTFHLKEPAVVNMVKQYISY